MAQDQNMGVMNQEKKWVSIQYSKDQENKVNKIFISSLWGVNQILRAVL